MRKLGGEGTLWLLPRLASESWPPVRSGTVNDLGVAGSEDIILVKCFEDGSISLTMGLVSKPNTCLEKVGPFCY